LQVLRLFLAARLSFSSECSNESFFCVADKSLYGLVVAAILSTSWLGLSYGDEGQKELAQVPIAPIAIADRAPLTNTLNVAGEFLPFQEVELHAKAS
jgi:hypothetical protein